MFWSELHAFAENPCTADPWSRWSGPLSFSNDRGSPLLFPYGRPQPCQAGSSKFINCPPYLGRGLPSRVTQHRKSLSLSACVLYGFFIIFTEWHLRRPQTQIPFSLLKQGPKRGPVVRAISRGRNHLAGPDFSSIFTPPPTPS